MQFDELQKLIHEFEQSSARELKIDDHDFHLYLSKNQQSIQQPTAGAPTVNNQTGSTTSATADTASDNRHQIKAPLVGTVYLQAKPKQPPYVTVGQHIHKGDIVCVVEAMKMMNEIKAPVSGEITEILAKNEGLVEYDQTIMLIKEC